MEIMKAIAKLIESDTQSGYVPTYLPRPVLHVKGKEVNGPRSHIKSLTFTDAVEQYGLKLREKDLEIAYERASLNFKGQMRQNFLVLMDRDRDRDFGTHTRPRGGRWSRGGGRGSGGSPSGRGRGGTKRSGDWSESEKKMPKR
jgi:hypothetical protein